MSWFSRKILTTAETKEGTAVELPSKLQVGQPAKLWVFDPAEQPFAIPCVILAVRIEAHHAVYYDLGFEIAQASGLFAQVKDFRGYVTDAETTEIDPEGGLVSADEVKRSLVSRLTRGRFS